MCFYYLLPTFMILSVSARLCRRTGGEVDFRNYSVRQDFEAVAGGSTSGQSSAQKLVGTTMAAPTLCPYVRLVQLV
jgi:hypothetical protein